MISLEPTEPGLARELNGLPARVLAVNFTLGIQGFEGEKGKYAIPGDLGAFESWLVR